MTRFDKGNLSEVISRLREIEIQIQHAGRLGGNSAGFKLHISLVAEEARKAREALEAIQHG